MVNDIREAGQESSVVNGFEGDVRSVDIGCVSELQTSFLKQGRWTVMKSYSNKVAAVSMPAILTRALALCAAALIALIAIGFVGCSASLPPSSKQVTVPGQTSADLYKKAVRSLVDEGYEIKSQDQSSGFIQAFRPLKGAFSKPGYGWSVTITFEKDTYTVKAFPAAGVMGPTTPEMVRDEVIKLIAK